MNYTLNLPILALSIVVWIVLKVRQIRKCKRCIHKGLHWI